MRVCLYQDLRNPPQWRRPWAQHYETAIERVERAEELGLDGIFLCEHHFFEDGYLSQPMVYAGALAARTKRMTIGTSISIAPLRPAVDHAEKAAMVDLISGGRFELGLGVGYRIQEFAAFGGQTTGRFEHFDTLLGDVRRLLDEGGVTPPPIQNPFPIWAGVLGPRGARIAGRNNCGVMWLDPALLEPLKEGLAEGGHDPNSARMAGSVNLILSSDPERAWARIAPHYQYNIDTYLFYGAEGSSTGQAGVKAFEGMGDQGVDPEALRSPGPQMTIPAIDVVTPDEAIARLRTWLTGMPVVQTYFWDSIAGMDDDLVEDHLQLLATKVKPAVADLGIT
jgi:alkanesulfonate monooxygenase SsuD/methylene tetrahydromethanopterin reductase-like flavin-dependent oxidoreductase (luciferase family)